MTVKCIQKEKNRRSQASVDHTLGVECCSCQQWNLAKNLPAQYANVGRSHEDTMDMYSCWLLLDYLASDLKPTGRVDEL